MLFMKNVFVLQHSNYMFDVYIEAVNRLYCKERKK